MHPDDPRHRLPATELTLAEKASLTNGSSFWYTMPVANFGGMSPDHDALDRAAAEWREQTTTG